MNNSRKTGINPIFQFILLFIFSCCTFHVTTYAQDRPELYLKKNYLKREYRIPNA